MKKKRYLSPFIKKLDIQTDILLAGSLEGNITDNPATEPAMSDNYDMDLEDDRGEKNPNIWEE